MQPTFSPSKLPLGLRRVGFTVIELMVSVGIVAILLTVAAPDLVAYQRNAQLTSAANSFLSTLSTARAEAMKRGLNVYIVPRTAGENWNTGWRAFADTNFTGAAFEEGTDVELAGEGALPSAITIGADAAADGFLDGNGNRYVRFNPAGYPSLIGGGFAGGGLELTIGSGSTLENRRVVVNLVGRMRVCKPAIEAATCTATGF